MAKPRNRSSQHPVSESEISSGLEEIRKLLLRPERWELDQLKERLDNPHLHARDISRVLPEAVALRASQDTDLSEALIPPVERAVKASVKRDPSALVEALYPIIGRTIRRTIAAKFREMMESFSRTVEHSFSPRYLKWRMEAWRSGTSFAEVVLIYTLRYRVEQAYLIDRRTGIVLNHVVSDPGVGQDPDLVSAMITAIQDFAHDSFDIDESESLDEFQIGELSVWIEQGPHAALAGVVRGTPPPDLRVVLQDALEDIHRRWGSELEAFTGDTQPLEVTRPVLEECLQEQFREESRKRGLTPFLVAGAAAILLLVLAAFYVRATLRWNLFVDSLNSQPGIVVTLTERGWFESRVSGLRDPLAPDPSYLVGEFEMDAEKVHFSWKPFYSLDPELVQRRAENALNPPPGAALEIVGGVCRASGEAPHQWVVTARRQALLIPGISDWDEEELVDTDLQQMQSMRAELERILITFEVGSALLSPQQIQVARQVAEELQRLLAAASNVGESFRVRLLGSADETGGAEYNLRLSQRRANAVRSRLVNAGIPASLLTAEGIGVSTGGQTEARRSTAFRVEFESIH